MQPSPSFDSAARREARPPLSRIPHSATTLGQEEADAAFVGRRFGVAVSSGTAALQLALRALDCGPGARVAQPSYACAALITATHQQRAEPVLCDAANEYNADGNALPDDCDAVIAVHLFGATASLPPHPRVIEDIAQSFGGPTGCGGVVSVTSFYATKMMTTGEGGMLFTDDEGLADEARDLRDYDNRNDYRPRHAFKMTDIQAAMGRVQLQTLPEFLAQRRAIAEQYNEAFADLPLELPRGDDHIYFRYVVALDQRAALEMHLRSHGIDAKRPVYRPAHHYLGGDFPGAERAHRRCVSLPIYPGLATADIARVIAGVHNFFD